MSERSCDEQLVKILNHPQVDELRLQLAISLEEQDPLRAKFIRLQVERSKHQRAAKETDLPGSHPEEDTLLRQHGKRWSNGLDEVAVRCLFDRGLVSGLVIDPYVFLDKGQLIFDAAPICHIGFSRPSNKPFPLRDLLACPLIANLDSLDMPGLGLGDDDVEMMAGSSGLRRCLVVNLSHNLIGPRSFRALASSTNTKALLYVGNDGVNSYHPGQQWISTDRQNRWDAVIEEWGPLHPDGEALEREFGYLPWLHIEDNTCDKFDARWFVEQGILPKRPAGSPVD